MTIDNFFKAIASGDVAAVRQALEAGMSPSAVNSKGESALDVACFNEQKAIVELLLNPPPIKKPDLAAEMIGDQDNPICIVGYSGIFPGSGSMPDGYWQTLSCDRHQMSEVPAERWSMEEFYSKDKKAPGKMYTLRGGFIDRSPYAFDADFFKIVPKEAEMMDPQQRLMLEAAWYALEHAGINPHHLKEQLVGVYCGIMTHDYTDMLIQSGVEHNNFIGTGNGASVLSGRISYFLGLQGPCMTVDTACSSSLVTTHLAMRSLQNGECDLALSGGVNAMLAPGVTINCCKAHMLSEDGVCKSFSAKADGYGRGEGTGMLVLKRYQDAARDGNTIHGIIRGSAVNQDGATSGLTVPNKQAQIKVIRKALETAGLSVDAIDFVEAHGTGTLLGDPIEMNALKEVFASRASKLSPVFVNSVKSFVGHLEAAAGVAGIIRVLESFKHQTLTALPIQEAMNPKIELVGTQLSILQHKRDWKTQDHRLRRAGVSSFGFSGTNAHMILEEPPKQTYTVEQKLKAQWVNERLPAPKRATIDHEMQLLTLSAKDEKALVQLVDQYIVFLEGLSTERPEMWLDIAYSSQIGRAHFPYRLVVKARSLQDCLAQLKQRQASSKSSESDLQVVVPGLTQVDLAAMQARYQHDVLFNALCHDVLTAELLSEDLQPVLRCLAGETTLPWQMEMTKLMVMYVMFLRYQRIGLRVSQLMSQKEGHFLAAVIDGRMSLASMLKLFKARILQEVSLYQEAVDAIVVYASHGSWQMESQNLCDDLYQKKLVDQTASSRLVISLHAFSQEALLQALSDLYLAGHDLNWQSVWQGSVRQFTQLPFYQFQRQQHRFAVKPILAQSRATDEPSIGGYCPAWEPMVLQSHDRIVDQAILVMVTRRQWEDSDWMGVLRQTLNQSKSRFTFVHMAVNENVSETCNKAENHAFFEGRESSEMRLQEYARSFDKTDDWQWLSERMRVDGISRVIDLRYFDLQSEQDALTSLSFSKYLVQRLYQNQLCFKVWPKQEKERTYIACFPKGQIVPESIQLCHAALQGQLQSMDLRDGQVVSVEIDSNPASFNVAWADLISYQVEGVAIKFEQQRWYVQKLIPSLMQAEPQRQKTFSTQEGIVITGGLGALGLTIARWYAEKGVKHIALIARRLPNEKQAAQILEIEKHGVSIRSYHVDVIKVQQLTQAIREISQAMTIRYVFHLAGMATIKRFSDLTVDDYRDSLSAKVLGAINLKQALMTLSSWPQQVVLFSSVASLLPELGQTTYAASNRVLDALGQLTHQTAQPMRVINWGLWGAAGAGANAEFVKRIRKGSSVLSEVETKTWLDRVLSAPDCQVAVLKIDWQEYQKHLTKREKVYVSSLYAVASRMQSAPVQPINRRAELLSLPESERRAKVVALVQRAVVAASGKSIDSLKADTTFEAGLNLDSNMEIDIKDSLQDSMGDDQRPYAATLLNEHASIGALTDYLLTDLAMHHRSTMQNFDTPTDYMRQLLQAREVQVKIKSLQTVREPQEPVLILIHTIMGSVFFYRALVDHLQYAGSIYGIDNPYFSNLSVKFKSIEDMSYAYAAKIKAEFAGQSVRLAGLSFAGVVAYEVAQQLSAMGVTVGSVLMFDTAMPGAGDLNLPQTQRQYVMGEVAADMNDYYQAEIDNNQRILNAYRPGIPKNNLRVTLLKARSRDSVNRALPSLNDVCNGWLTLFCPEVYSVPGSHFSLFDRTYIETTAQTIRYVYSNISYFVDKQLQVGVARNKEKLLLQAARNGDSYLILRLLKDGVNPMVEDETGRVDDSFAEENDDLCSLAWIHNYAKKQLSMTALLEWAIKGNALKTTSYLVEHQDGNSPEEPDIMLTMDLNKKQEDILHGRQKPYQQREWMEVLAAHNASARGAQQPGAMTILPPTQPVISTELVTAHPVDVMAKATITCGSRFKYDIVTQLKTGNPSKPNLFMFHAAGGLALPYSSLDDLDFGHVYGISNPYFGLLDQPGFHSIEEMAQHYVDRIKQIQPAGPYYLAGWSLGGIVSQAMASILEANGEVVGLVLMIDSVNHFGKPYHQNSEQAAIEKILEGNATLKRYEGIKEAITQCYRRTSELLHIHQAKPCAARVVLLKADEHEIKLPEDADDLLRWRHTLLEDPFSGWGNLLPNFEIQSVSGSHHELFESQYIKQVHALLKGILATAYPAKPMAVALSQRWGMNLVKAVRREDTKIIQLLLQKPSHDLSYQDVYGNLLDAIVSKEKPELLEKLDKQALMLLQTSSGSKASDLALEFGLIDLFSALEVASSSGFDGSAHGFFHPSSPKLDGQASRLGLQ